MTTNYNNKSDERNKTSILRSRIGRLITAELLIIIYITFANQSLSIKYESCLVPTRRVTKVLCTDNAVVVITSILLYYYADNSKCTTDETEKAIMMIQSELYNRHEYLYKIRYIRTSTFVVNYIQQVP